jgi:thymidylate kinase
MLKDTKIHQIIGISGAARSGKDTLCRAIIRVLSNTYNINAIRRSIAGDQVKKDLQELLLKNLKIDSFTEDMTVKEEIRPLLVEYGKLMRNKTEGRYFIEKFEKIENTINIIPDIRYVEYPKDEA